MSKLKQLKSAKTLSDVAQLVGFKPSGLSYVLYKQQPAEKYKEFDIPKKNGEMRKISAPLGALKEIQRALADLLNECRTEILVATPRKPISHGFTKKPPKEASLPKERRGSLSILTNAHNHKNRRYVFNLDLEDFFPSLNFGRVRGFFIKNHDYELDPKVATIIAQIACYKNELPQGSPCSPVIADMITHVLDVRLVNLAKDSGATYSRYADDLTFSANMKVFPAVLAVPGATIADQWEIGEPLLKIINRTGFNVNPAKTRVQIRQSRQTVTGLTVNAKVNITSEYARSARSMCHSLFTTGSYFKPVQKSSGKDPDPILSIEPLTGILSHIYRVKKKSGLQPKGKNAQDEKRAEHVVFGQYLHERFWFYRYFVAPPRALIVCEGPTDSIYLRQAIRQLAVNFPQLGKQTPEGFEFGASFFSYTNTAHKILGLTGGGSQLIALISRFRRSLKPYKHRPMAHPIIVLFDNDTVISAKALKPLNEQFGLNISTSSTEAFYHLTDNLYLVKTPEGTAPKVMSCIEDLFDEDAKKMGPEGKTLHTEKEGFDHAKHIDKMHFAEQVVAKKAKDIKWEGFTPLLERIAAVLEHYNGIKAAAPP